MRWHKRGTELITGSDDQTVLVWEHFPGRPKQRLRVNTGTVRRTLVRTYASTLAITGERAAACACKSARLRTHHVSCGACVVGRLMYALAVE